MRTMSACCLTVYAKSPGFAIGCRRPQNPPLKPKEGLNGPPTFSFQLSVRARRIEKTRALLRNCELERGSVEYTGLELLWRSCGKRRFAFDKGGKRASPVSVDWQDVRAVHAGGRAPLLATAAGMRSFRCFEPIRR